MIQVNTLKAAGISEQEIRQLETALEALQIAKNQACHQAPHIVCTGIYNAGKSTLLNSLAGKEIFPTGDIPTTKKSAQAEFSGAVYIDTPGLNAMEDDDRETQAAYETADFILFVANAQNGGVSAAEAMWLQKLKERYGSLQQRLIFALTHSAQVDPEQLPGICEKVRGDFKKAVGFEPEPLLCVDSVTWQRGTGENKPALVERSGIPLLQGCLAEHIASAEKTLREAQENEIAARRRDMLNRIESFASSCRYRLQKASAQKQLADISAIFASTEKAVIRATDSHAYVFIKGIVAPYGESFEGKSEGTAKREARSYLESMARDLLSAARDSTASALDQAEQSYGNDGPNSDYFKKRSEINGILEKLLLSLVQQGTRIQAGERIQIQRNLSSFSSELGKYRNNTSYWSAYEYRDIYENRMEVSKSEYGYLKRGFFGSEKWVPQYTIYTNRAVSQIEQKIRETFVANLKRAQEWIDQFYWQPYLKELRTAAIAHLKELRTATEASVSTAAQELEKPYQSALRHLDTLQKEVLQ